MCVLTGIITALGTIGTAITGAVGGSVVGGTVAGATVAGTVGAATGISAGAAVGIGAAATAIGAAAVGAGAIGLSKAMSNKNLGNSGNLSINTEKRNKIRAKQSPTSLTDTVSKSADKMVDTNRKSNPLSSLRIKQTMNNRQETGINTANDTGTGLNLGG